MHARFTLGRDVLKPYKVTIDRWLWPDVFKNQDTSVAKAKKAISEYKKAIGQPQGLAELMVFYCERASGFSADIDYQDDDYFDALVRMFEQSLKMIATLPDAQRPALWGRLAQVRRTSDNFGYGDGGSPTKEAAGFAQTRMQEFTELKAELIRRAKPATV